jgi:hypothetical protein
MNSDIITEPNGTKVITTSIAFGKNPVCNGKIIRAYNKEYEVYEMRYSYFDECLPKWVKDVPVPLVAGKGIPTILYFDLYSMKRLGADEHGVKTVVIFDMHDPESAFHLTWLHHKYPDKPLGDLFRSTRLFRSRENVFIQASLKVDNVKIDLTGSVFNHPQHMLNEQFTEEKMKLLCSKYQITDQDMIFWRFNVIIAVVNA